jgi:transcriptional regulator with GAF, ATPase, and Fis domain/tetratricopeptide (TPR) repeat protein
LDNIRKNEPFLKEELYLLKYTFEKNKNNAIFICITQDEQEWEDKNFKDFNPLIIKLKGLDLKATSQMIEGMVPGISISDKIVTKIYEATGGIPLSIEEIIKTLVQRTKSLESDLEKELELFLKKPSSLKNIQTLQSQRLSLLEDKPKRILELLSLCPYGLSWSIFKKLFQDKIKLTEIEKLTQGGFLRIESPEKKIKIANVWLKDILYKGINSEKRIKEHKRILTLLEKTSSANLENLAYQAKEAKITPKAILYLKELAKEKSTSFDLEEASSCLRQALELTKPKESIRKEIFKELIKLRKLAGDQTMALKLCQQLIGELEQGSLEFYEGIIEKADILISLAEYPEAISLLKTSLDKVFISKIKTSIYHRLSKAYLLKGEYKEAERWAKKGLSEKGVRNTLIWADLEHVIGLSLFYRGKYELAHKNFQRSIEGYRTHHYLRGMAKVFNSIGLSAHQSARYEKAEEAFSEALKLAKKLQDRQLEANYLMNLGTVYQEMGLSDQALGHYLKGIEIAKKINNEFELTRLSRNLANLYIFLGEYDKSQELTEEVISLAQRHDMEETKGYAFLLKAEAEVLKERWTKAYEFAKESERIFKSFNQNQGLVQVYLLNAQIAYERKDWNICEKNINQCLKICLKDKDIKARVLLLQGKFYLEHRFLEVGEAIQILERALSLTKEIRSLEPTWEIHYYLSRAYKSQDKKIDADYHLQKAKRLIEKLREHVPQEFRLTFDKVRSRREFLQFIKETKEERAKTEPSFQIYRSFYDILEITKELAREHELNRLLEIILDKAINLSKAERGLLILGSPTNINIMTARNIDKADLEKEELRISKTLVQETIRMRRSILIQDALGDKRFLGAKSIHQLGLRSVLILPMLSKGKAIGVLYLDDRFQPYAFKDSDIPLLEAFADQAALAIENAKLIASAKEKEKELELANKKMKDLNTLLEKDLKVKTKTIEKMKSLLWRGGRQFGQAQKIMIIGQSQAMEKIFQLIEQVKDSDVPVHIFGESGTGKELVAKAIHYSGLRAERDFVSINCAAIPGQLLESELFGHVKGAFTGAIRTKQGLFEIAKGGTILLDEIGDMPLEMQTKLLRVLEDGRFRRVGDEKEIETDARVISTTNKDLRRLVKSGQFREDLFYRINVIQIFIPPLRHRPEDISILVEYFLRLYGKGKKITPAALDKILNYKWPGNIRQLQNELLRAITLSKEKIKLEDLSIISETNEEVKKEIKIDKDKGFKEMVEEFESEVIKLALNQTNRNIKKAAELLKLSRVALYRKMSYYKIKR